MTEETADEATTDEATADEATADEATAAQTAGDGDVDHEIDLRLAALVVAVSAACAVLLTLYATGVI